MNGNLVDESGLVLDAFAGNFDNKVKYVTEPNNKLSWLMMYGGMGVSPPRPSHSMCLSKNSGRDSTGTCVWNGHCVVP